MGTYISFFNCKGGVGKTTCAVNVSAALALQGNKVLLVDLDPHANASFVLSHRGNSTHTHTHTHTSGDCPCQCISNLFRNSYEFSHIVSESAIENLDFMASSLQLYDFEIDFASKEDAIFILARRLLGVGEVYDYVIFDPPPRMGLLSVSSLVASCRIIIPVQMHFYSMYSLVESMRLLEVIRMQLNIKVSIEGIVPTFIDERIASQKKKLEEIIDSLGCSVLMPGIRFDQSLADAPAEWKTIFEYDSESKGAADYAKLANIIQRRFSNRRKEQQAGQAKACYVKRSAFRMRVG